MRSSNQAVFARMMFTFELAERLEGTGVTAVAFHPGFIKSNLVRNPPWYLRMSGKVANLFAKGDCEIGVYLSAAKEVESVSGVLFDDKMEIVPFHEAYDEEIGRKLWNISEGLTGHSAE